MRKAVGIPLIIVAAFLALIVLTLASLAWYVHTQSFKNWLVTKTSRAMGMQLQVIGDLRIGLFPHLHLVVRQVHLFNRNTQLGEAGEADVQVAFLPLLAKRVEVTAMEIDRPRFTIERAPDGELNVIRSSPPLHRRPHGPMEITVKDGTILYRFGATQVFAEAEGCDAALHNLRTDAPDGRRVTERISFNGDMTCSDAHIDNFTATNVKVAGVAHDGGDIRLDPITMQAFGSEAKGSVHAQLSSAGDRYSAQYSLPQLEIQSLMGAVTKKEYLDGRADFDGEVTFEGHSIQDILHTLTGPVSLQGKEIRLNGFDADEELSRFEATQHLNLADLVAVILAGPVGVVATKGYDYARLIPKKGGTSTAHVLVARVHLDHGIATAEDVAASTDKHRLAAQGAVDVPAKKFDGTTVATVNAEGCATAAITINGPFLHPKLKKGTVLKILAGPVTNLARKGKNLVSKSGCPVFYQGAVPPY